jgi:hypothetical protein
MWQSFGLCAKALCLFGKSYLEWGGLRDDPASRCHGLSPETASVKAPLTMPVYLLVRI